MSEFPFYGLHAPYDGEDRDDLLESGGMSKNAEDSHGRVQNRNWGNFTSQGWSIKFKHFLNRVVGKSLEALDAGLDYLGLKSVFLTKFHLRRILIVRNPDEQTPALVTQDSQYSFGFFIFPGEYVVGH